MINVKYIRAFDDNYIWLLHDDKQQAVVVDPGDAEPVLAALQAERLTPVAVLITHHHYDHTGGLHQLVTAYAMPVYAPAHENVRYASHAVKDGDELSLLGGCFQVIEVPGHTKGHVMYYGEGMLFCGDTLFTGGCGRLFEGTAAQMHTSLNKITALPDDTQIYCAHEYTAANLRFAQIVEPDSPALKERIDTTAALRINGHATVPALLSLEKQTNPFLRCHLPPVKAAAEQFAGRSLSEGAAVFATIRYWKDTLD